MESLLARVLRFPYLAVAMAVPAALRAQQPTVAKIIVTPASPTVVVGETVRLEAQAVDSAGHVVPNVTIRFQRSGGIFEGGVNQTGVVSAGAPGTITVNISAIVEGQRPVIRRLT